MPGPGVVEGNRLWGSESEGRAGINGHINNNNYCCCCCFLFHCLFPLSRVRYTIYYVDTRTGSICTPDRRVCARTRESPDRMTLLHLPVRWSPSPVTPRYVSRNLDAKSLSGEGLHSGLPRRRIPDLARCSDAIYYSAAAISNGLSNFSSQQWKPKGFI